MHSATALARRVSLACVIRATIAAICDAVVVRIYALDDGARTIPVPCAWAVIVTIRSVIGVGIEVRDAATAHSNLSFVRIMGAKVQTVRNAVTITVDVRHAAPTYA
jgi:hypothetical protein